jgi:hypothetical protein
MMSNVVSLYDFARRHRAVTPPAEIDIAQVGVDAARSASGNWHAIVAGFEQMRDSLDVLRPSVDARPNGEGRLLLRHHLLAFRA